MGSKLINDQFQKPQPKKQMSERSLVKSNTTQSCSGSVFNNITTTTMNNYVLESKDNQMDKVKRSFMSKCKNMQDKNGS